MFTGYSVGRLRITTLHRRLRRNLGYSKVVGSRRLISQKDCSHLLLYTSYKRHDGYETMCTPAKVSHLLLFSYKRHAGYETTSLPSNADPADFIQFISHSVRLSWQLLELFFVQK